MSEISREGGTSTDGDSVELRKRATLGMGWAAVNIVLSRGLQFGTTLIATRLIAPEHFGALAVALVVQTLAQNLSELGATAALGRGEAPSYKVAPTVFTITLVSSTALTAVMLVFAPEVGRLLGDPGAAGAIRVMSIVVMLVGLGAVPAALVWRNFQQKTRMLLDVANACVALALLVPLALAGFEDMALTWSRVGGQLVSTVGFWLLVKERYWPGWNKEHAPQILRLGLPLGFSNLIAVAILNLDYAVISREMDAASLGLYLVAFNLASLPSTVIMSVVRAVAVPVFGRLHAQGTLGQNSPVIGAAVNLAAFPVAALIGGLAVPLVVVLYGPEWRPASEAMVGLALFGAARILTEVLQDMGIGSGRTVGVLLMQCCWLATLLPVMSLSVSKFGLAGAGWAQAGVAWLVVVPLYLLMARRALGLRLGAFAAHSLVPLLGAVAAGFGAYWFASRSETPFGGLVGGAIVGLCVYLAVAGLSSYLYLRRSGKVVGRLR